MLAMRRKQEATIRVASVRTHLVFVIPYVNFVDPVARPHLHFDAGRIPTELTV